MTKRCKFVTIQAKKTNPWVKAKVAIGRRLSYIRTGDQSTVIVMCKSAPLKCSIHHVHFRSAILVHPKQSHVWCFDKLTVYQCNITSCVMKQTGLILCGKSRKHAIYSALKLVTAYKICTVKPRGWIPIDGLLNI